MASWNSNYMGDDQNWLDFSRTISDGSNTTVWITRILADITYHALLSSIRRTGAIKASFINRPIKNPIKNHQTCAAKVIFFECQASQRLYDSAQEGTFLVLGAQPIVQWHRIGSRTDPPRGRSRVLRIEGPTEVMNRKWLEGFWSTDMFWNVNNVREFNPVRLGVGVVWYTFGSWRCQASKAKKTFEDAFPGVFQIYYKPDPCAEERHLDPLGKE